ncbi:hypothetical protein E2C01_099702 [Portunus trituberculatus]|uniref:Uncharacterized protein n=2 Tax=Portunus trituberculatus TaxID=210409 RepID=A0A5B7KBE6_PORTR|nr:hypothetical protein [Portunus trituberculatus]
MVPLYHGGPFSLFPSTAPCNGDVCNEATQLEHRGILILAAVLEVAPHGPGFDFLYRDPKLSLYLHRVPCLDHRLVLDRYPVLGYHHVHGRLPANGRCLLATC